MTTFLLIFNALPAILQSVQAIEAIYSTPQAGPQKMNLILGAAEAAWEASPGGQPLSKSNTVQAVQTIATLAVASLNAVGIFKHATPVSSK
jgi:hypothetical protein